MSDDLDRLDKLDKLAEAATPGPWAFACAPAEGSDESPAEYIEAALTGEGPLFVVWVPSTEGHSGGYRLTAVTGDGEHAGHDSEFIAATDPTVVRALVQRVRDAEAERDAALAREAKVRELVEQWNSAPDYTLTAYDRGRVDQRHDMTEMLFAALDADGKETNE